MSNVCPHCGYANRSAAKYCGRCGLWLEPARKYGELPPGRWPHPAALSPPAGYEPVAESAHLYYRSESAFGGQPLLPTEGLRIALFNGGYGLEEVSLEVVGSDDEGNRACRCVLTIERLEQGRIRTVELPSYEIERPLTRLGVRLAGARFAEDWQS